MKPMVDDWKKMVAEVQAQDKPRLRFEELENVPASILLRLLIRKLKSKLKSTLQRCF